MPPAMRIIPWFVLAFALVALVLGWREMSAPPFTDEQLKASLVNTWEVATSTTRVFAIVFFGLGAISLVLARKATETTTRLVAYAGAVACLFTLMLYLRNHIELTQRATSVTGQEFGPLYGLL